MRKKLSALICLSALLLLSCAGPDQDATPPPSPLERDIEKAFMELDVSLSKVSEGNTSLSALTLTNTTNYPIYLIDAGFSEKKTPSKKLYTKQKHRFQAAMGKNFSPQKYDAFRAEKPLSGRAQRLRLTKPGETATLFISLDHYIGKKAPLSGTDEALLGEMLPCLKPDCISVLIKDKKSRYRWINIAFPAGDMTEKTISLDDRMKLMTYQEDWPFKTYDIPVFPGRHLNGYVDIKTGDTTLVIYNTTEEEFSAYKESCLKAGQKDSLAAEMVEGRLVIADRTNGRLFIIFRDAETATVTIENHHA